jgi:uncharacterized protein
LNNIIDANTLEKMFLAGTKYLENKKDWINELNVFPVPDGDTGTNMMMTLMSAVNELKQLNENARLSDIGSKISSGTLRGARGNSGVIMSQLCRGFANGIADLEIIDKNALVTALEKAVAAAYKAVMNPKEGTILTVASAAADKARSLVSEDLSMQAYLAEIRRYAEYILTQTPDMLPVLKEAGVVDSGGQGLVEFFRGAYDAFCGKDINLTFGQVSGSRSASAVDSSNITTADIKFGYCTEFIIELAGEYTTSDDEEFKHYLASVGDSIVCVSMDDIVKVHVHTNHPGEVIEKALTYGELTSLKIDNMRIEHHEKVIMEADKAMALEAESGSSEIMKSAAAKKQLKPLGFVAVSSGDGLAEIFKSLKVDYIIEGGQTMNPSTSDIINAVNSVDAESVIILPNNGNIIMAANQAKMMCEGKYVYVVPTNTICQGINAMINLVPSLDAEGNVQVMTEAAEDVKSGEVTYAIRTTDVNGMHIEKGDYMGIGDGNVLAVSEDKIQAAADMINAMSDEETEIITIYYGESSTEEEAQELADIVEESLPDADIEIAYGGQNVYDFFVSVE